MNKAFVREPDPTADYCPRCGSKGEPVGAVTLRGHLSDEQLGRIAEAADFCPSPDCPVAYFDSFERTVLAAELPQPVYPKDPQAPICACFGLLREEVEQDVWDGETARVKAAIEKAKSAAAGCLRAAANGRSCIPYVQKYYMQCLARKNQGGRDAR